MKRIETDRRTFMSFMSFMSYFLFNYYQDAKIPYVFSISEQVKHEKQKEIVKF